MRIDIHSPTPSERKPRAQTDGPSESAVQTLSRLLQLAVVGLLIGVLLFQEVKLPVSVQALFVILLLLLVGRTSAMPLLVAFQVVLYFRETKSSSSASNDLGSSLFVVIVLGLLMFLSRDQSLKRFTRRSVTDLAQSLLALWHGSLARDVPAPRERRSTPPRETPPQGSLIRLAMMLVISVLTAQVLLMAFPIPSEVQRGQQSFEDVKQALASAPTLLAALIATVSLMSWLAWRRLTPEQASVYARSTMVMLLYPDIRLIVRHRLSFRRRQRQPPPVSAVPVVEPLPPDAGPQATTVPQGSPVAPRQVARRGVSVR